MEPLSTAEQGCPIAKLRFHPRERLLASVSAPLASIHGPRAEACVWTWDESGELECLARIRQDGAERISDVAWHPSGDSLAIATPGRAIELRSASEGDLIREYGKRPVAPRTVSFGRTQKVDFPVERQGYDNVIFSADGDRLVAGTFVDDRTEVYGVDSGERIESFWPSDTTLALHPEGEILATLTSEQLASSIRFGRLTDRFQGYNVQLNVFADGYQRLVFSPGGDAFAIIGHAYGTGVRVFEFPSCRTRFGVDFEKGPELLDGLWKKYRDSGHDPARPDGSYRDKFCEEIRFGNDRLAFHPDGRTLLVGTVEGLVVGIDPEDPTRPSGVWTAHDGPAVALDVSTTHALLATARWDGRLRPWRLDGAPSPRAPDARPMTEAFREMYETIGPHAPEDSFRTTDGKRWYDFETIGEEELDDDAPPWAQIASMMKRKGGPEDPKASDPGDVV